MDCNPPGSSVHGILQARILEWVAMPSSRGSSPPRDRTCVSRDSSTGRQILYPWATWELESACKHRRHRFSSVQSVTLSRVWLFVTRWIAAQPGLPLHHQVPEFTQTHVRRVSDAIQPSHPLSSPSPAPNPSQHQGLFQWVNSSHQVAKVLEFQPQHQSFQWTSRTGLL